MRGEVRRDDAKDGPAYLNDAKMLRFKGKPTILRTV